MAAYSHIITVDPDASLWGLWDGVLCIMWGHVTWATPRVTKQVVNRDSSPGKAGTHDKCGTLVCTICPTS